MVGIIMCAMEIKFLMIYDVVLSIPTATARP